MFKTYFIYFILSLLIIGVLPYKYSYFEKNTDHLLIRRQECGCPCAEAIIEKGTLIVSNEVKKKYPTLMKKNSELTLVNFPPFNNISNEKLETFDLANFNKFYIKGEIKGIDSVQCGRTEIDIIPILEISEWSLATYYPSFKTLNILIQLFYLALAPVLLVLIILQKRKK